MLNINKIQKWASKIAKRKVHYMCINYGYKPTKGFYRHYKNEELAFMQGMTMDKILDYKNWSLDLPREDD